MTRSKLLKLTDEMHFIGLMNEDYEDYEDWAPSR